MFCKSWSCKWCWVSWNYVDLGYNAYHYRLPFIKINWTVSTEYQFLTHLTIYFHRIESRFFQVRSETFDGYWCSDFHTFVNDASTGVVFQWMPKQDFQVYAIPINVRNLQFLPDYAYISKIKYWRSIPKMIKNGWDPYQALYMLQNKRNLSYEEIYEKWHLEDWLFCHERDKRISESGRIYLLEQANRRLQC